MTSNPSPRVEELDRKLCFFMLPFEPLGQHIGSKKNTFRTIKNGLDSVPGISVIFPPISVIWTVFSVIVFWVFFDKKCRNSLNFDFFLIFPNESESWHHMASEARRSFASSSFLGMSPLNSPGRLTSFDLLK